MRKYLFYAIIFLLIANTASAQNGYSITLKNKAPENKTIYLSVYQGTRSKFFIIDSARFSKKKTQKFLQTKRIIGGIYRLHTSKTNKKEYVDISVENGDQLVFNLPTSNIKDITTNDSRNSLFLKQQNLPKSEKNKALLHTLSQDYTNTALCEYAQIEAMKYEKPPIEIIALENYRNTYFSSIDLHGKYFQLLPNAYSCLFRFIKTLPINNENYIKSANLILKGQNCNSRNFKFLLSWLFKNINYFGNYNLNEAYKTIFNSHLNQVECINRYKTFYHKILNEYKHLDDLPVGSKLPDFIMERMDGNKIKSPNAFAKHDYTFIAFYDPDCIHCQEKMPEVDTFVNSLKNNKKIDLQSIAFINTPDHSKWNTFIKEHKLTNWLHVKNGEKNRDYQKRLLAEGNPTFYLVDRNGIILIDKFNPKAILSLIGK